LQPEAASEAVRATVRGRVQAVGFRDATVSIAHRLGVQGWVRNADDGAL
jgi:acylphosphatase